ncbi:hypothetical protein [Mesorhizobium helmanticense]|uniref:DUF883 domain-containing protein n=1 Tax=Mesorhizobium helmanticense TaxID=1776423 RepID=A0A2T4IQ05_9HYPH|nr:hypothetical protein [Mesorhizobium helmanticense]PTE07741.1 hypothetical protein C9427_24995 [Mesorhizobium helmanticense]
MKKQIAELRREVSRLNRALSEQAEEAVETAHGWYDSAADRASRAAKQLRSQAQSVSETVQQNPGTISTAAMLGGFVGVLIGLTIARSVEPQPNWFHRRWHD